MDSMDSGGMMMRDEEEGSAIEELPPPGIPICPFGCHCQLRVVQCSDLGQCDCVWQRERERHAYVALSFFLSMGMPLDSLCAKQGGK